MAVIKKYDAAGDTAAQDLIGESGYYTLQTDERYTFEFVSDNGRTYTERTNYDGNYVSYAEYDYTVVTSPAPDLKFTAMRSYDTSGNLLEEWTSLNILNSDLVKTGSVGLFEGEDSVEGNSSANYLQGAVGDDTLVGLAGNDTLDGGRADDILYGGTGNDILYGGLGTDTALFVGALSNYTLSLNSDGSIAASSSAEGADTLYDIEKITFSYGTASEVTYYTSEMIHGTKDLISGWESYAANAVSGDKAIVMDGTSYTFTNNENLISWALADDSTYPWADVEGYQDLIGDALEEYSKVADLNFQYFGHYSSVSAADTSGANFIFKMSDLGDWNSAGQMTVAQAFFPSNYHGDTYYPYFNFIMAGPDNTLEFNKWALPSFSTESMYQTILHEIGHSLGLKHPFNAGYANPNSSAKGEYDNTWTIMSYTDASSANPFGAPHYASTPMSLDVLALEYIYGRADLRDFEGDTEHAVISSNSYQTMVDYSGINTINFSTAAQGWTIFASDPSSAGYAIEQEQVFPNAQLIELLGTFYNITGSTYDDTIFGSTVQNIILEGEGNDVIVTFGGGDIIDGGAGADTLIFTQDISNLAFTETDYDVYSVFEGSTLLARLTNIETFVFGFGSGASYERSLDQINITDTAGTITATLSASSVSEDQRISVQVLITDYNDVVDYSVQWQSEIGGTWQDISGAYEEIITLTQDQVGAAIRAKVTYVDGLGNIQSGYSSTTSSVQNINDAPIGQPSITGVVDVGQVLTAKTGQIYDEDGAGSYSYQWQRSGDSITWSNISNATSDSYTVVKADAFNTLRIEVSYQDGQGTSETVRSGQTQFVNPSNFAPTGAPVIA